MAKQLNVDMSIRADTSQAKQAMMELQKSLNDILATRTITVNDTSINNAKQAAIDLKHHLEAATNVQTGKLDLSKFSASLNKSGQSLQGLYNNLSQIGPAGQSAFLALSKSIAKADASAITLGGKLNGLMVTLKNTAKWQLSSSLLHGFMGAIQGAYGYAQDLNKSLNNIRVVTGQNIDQMAKFAKEANNAAKALSTTTTEYTDAALIYYQQGLTDEQVKERTDATIKLANVSRQSAEEVSSQMTAIWNNFDDGSKSLEYYEDVITALGASTASSSQEIAEGLSKFAAVADTVGLSYDKAAAAVSTVVAETRQSADTVGTAFKTMFARVEGLKLGETLEDNVDLNKYSKALQSVGVNILDTSGQLKEMDDILDELGEKWASIDKTQQVALAQTVAGVRQYTQFVALMDNYDKVQKNQGIAENSEGTVDEQAKIYAESWEAARDRVTAAAEEIYDQLLNDEAFIDILNGVEKFLGFISNIIDGLGGLKGILLLIGSILMQQYAKEVPAMMEKMAMNIRILTGEEEKRRQVMLKENAENVKNLSNTGNAQVDAQIAGQKKISAMYADLAQQRKNLSQAEIADAENKIREIEIRTENAAAIGKEIDQLQKKNQILESGIRQSLANNKLYDKKLNTENMSDANISEDQQQAVKEGMNASANLTTGVTQLQEKIDTLKAANKEVSKELQESLEKAKIKADSLAKSMTGKDLFKSFKDGNVQLGKMNAVLITVGNKTRGWSNALEQAVKEGKSTESITKEMESYIQKAKEAGINTKDVEEALADFKNGKISVEELTNSFETLSNEGALEFGMELEKIESALVNLGVNKNKLNELKEQLQSGAISAEQYKAEIEALANTAQTGFNHMSKLSEGLAQMGSAVMQVSMAINALKNLGNIWSNEDLSTGEKILQTMTTLGTLIPIITTLMNQEKIAQMGITAARILGITSINGETVAHLASIPAKEAAGAAGWAALGPALAFIAIAAAIVAAIGLIVYGLVQLANAETSEEKAARLANEELDRSKKAAEEAKSAYEDLKNQISSYDDAVKALEECTKGTQEWRDALQEVMNQISEIIAAHPELLKYDDLYKNGILNREKLEEALNTAERTSIAASNAVLANTVAASSADLDNNYTKLKESVRLDFGVQEYATGTNENNLEIISAADVAEEVMNAAIANSKDIIFEDANQVDKFVAEQLEKFNLYGSNLEVATTQIADELIACSSDIKELGKETENLTNEMFNASNVIFDSYFADKKFKDTNEKIAYQKAYDEVVAQIKKTTDIGIAAAYSGQHSDDINWQPGLERSSETMGTKVTNKYYTDQEWDAVEYKKVIEDYEKATGNKVDRDNTEDWKGGNVVELRLSEGDNVNMQDVKDIVYNYRVGQAMAEIEKQGDEYYKKMKNQPIDAEDYFAARGNFDEVSYNELSKSLLDKDGQIKAFEDIFEGNEEAMKQAVANKLQKDVDDVSEADIELVKGYYEKTAEMAAAELEEIPDYVKDHLGSDLINEIDLGSLENVGDMYTKILANSGQEGLSILDTIVTKSGDQADEVLGALSNMDLTAMSAEDVNTALADLGINFQLTEGEVYSLGNMLRDTSTMTAETAQETYKAVSSILSKLKEEGDIIEQEDYEQLLKLNPALSSYFTMMADGTYMLTGAAQDFKTAVQTTQMYQMQQAISNQQNTADAYGILSNSSIVSQDEITAAKIQVLSDNAETKDIANRYRAEIAAGKELSEINKEVAQSYDELELSEDEFAQKAQKATEEVNKLTHAMKESQYQNELSNAGLDYETTENYANVLMEVHEAEGLSKDGARELAIANQRLDRGLTSLNDNFEQWSSNLKNNSKNTAEYAQTIGDLREAFSDLLNIADGNELSLGWIEKWANDAEAMKKILDGDTEAIEEFRESAFTEMTTNVFEDVKNSVSDLLDTLKASDDPAYYTGLKNLFNELDNGAISAEGLRQAIQDIGNQEIGAGAKLSDDYVESLNQMLRTGVLTEQQLNDIFASIGYKPKVKVESVDQWVDIPEYETIENITETKPNLLQSIGSLFGGSVQYSRTVTSTTRQIGTKSMKQTVPIAQIESSDKAGGNIEIINAGSTNINPSYGSTTSGKNSSSGSSGSSSTPTTKAASHDHEVNRYSNEENALKGLSDQYERLSKAKDKAYGQDRINAIDREIKKLKQLKEASGDYLEAIVGAGNASTVAKAIYNGENIGAMVANGQIGGTLGADYSSLYSGASASGKQIEYTAKDEAGNEWLVTEGYSLGGFNSLFGTNLDFSLDQYGNLQNKDAILNLLNNIKNAENDSYSSIANPDAWSTTEYNKRMAYLEAIKERVDQYSDTAELAFEKSDAYLEYISQIQDKNAEKITTKMNTGVELGERTAKKLDRALKVLGDNIYKSVELMGYTWSLNQEKINSGKKNVNDSVAIINETEAAWRAYMAEGGQFNENAISSEQAAEIFKQLEDNVEGELDTLLETMEFFGGFYENTLKYWNDKMNAAKNLMRQNMTTLDHYQKIMELSGRSQDYEMMGKILAEKKKAAVDLFNIAQQESDNAKQYYNELLEQQATLEASGTATAEQLEKMADLVATAELDYVEKHNAALESCEEVLEAAQAEFDNNVNKIFSNYEKTMTGAYGSFDALDKQMERQKSLSEDYLTTTNQLYETNKMLRSLNQDIDKTDNQMAKSKLKSFADEISAMQQQNKLSKVELDIAKARYDVLKAEIALEEAKNAKSTVRLQRDNNGNYGYVYTADQELISDAEQELEDKQNALYNLVLNFTQDYAEKLLQIEYEHEQALQEIYNNTSLTTEQREAEILRINEYYNAKRQAVLEAHNIAIGWLDKTAATSRAEAWTESFETTIQDQNEYEQHVKALVEELNNQMYILDQERDTYTEQANAGNKSIEDSIDDVSKSVGRLNNEIVKPGGLIDAMDQAMYKAMDLTKTFIDQYDELATLRDYYRSVADKINDMTREILSATSAQRELNAAIAEAANISYTSSTPASYSMNYDDNGGSSGSDGGSSGSRSSSSPQRTIVSTSGWKHNDIRHWQERTYSDGITTQINGGNHQWVGTGFVGGGRYGVKCKICGAIGETYLSYGPYSDKDILKVYKYKTGGYTGTWSTSGKTGLYTGTWNGPDLEENGKLAFLHQKELVLNASDTENMLSAVKLIRQISQNIDLQAMTQSSAFQMTAAQLASSDKVLQQEVTITAEFPNVSDHNEIEQAFNNLVNRASQFANRI